MKYSLSNESRTGSLEEGPFKDLYDLVQVTQLDANNFIFQLFYYE